MPSYAITLPKPDASGNTCAPMFFRSWQARGLLLGPGVRSQEYDFPLASIARAASAAPTYFPSATIVNKAGQSFSMIDGGVFANNPTMTAIVEAYHLYHSKNIMVVLLGTGIEPLRINASKASNWGDIFWEEPMITFQACTPPKQKAAGISLNAICRKLFHLEVSENYFVFRHQYVFARHKPTQRNRIAV